MPITTASTFFTDFNSGDLIYGTEIDRVLYYPVAQLKSTKYTIDSLTSGLDDTKGFRSYLPELSSEQWANLPQSAQHFLEYARKTTFFKKMKGVGANNYTKNGVAKAMPDLGTRMKWSDAYFRAKCKAGIGFVIDSGFTVRFVLDSLNSAYKMETIARKESDQPWHTGSELRYLYKKRGDARTSNQVVFYVDGEPVQAPWVSFSDAWGNYSDTRVREPYVPDHARRY